MLFLSTLGLNAQKTKDYSKSTATINSVIETFYAVISADKGIERDWELFKILFHKDVTLTNTQDATKYTSPEDYIKTNGMLMVENGLHTVELNRNEQTVNEITEVISTYKSYKNIGDTESFSRGTYTIKLKNNCKRWYIINLSWTQE